MRATSGGRGDDALVAVTQPPELLLSRGIPAEEAQLATVGHEVQRMHLRVAVAAARLSVTRVGSNSITFARGTAATVRTRLDRCAAAASVAGY